MSDIVSIVNLVAYQGLTGASFVQKTSLTHIQPQECVIRSINYSAASTDVSGTYLIYSNLINNFIGSFSIALDGTHTSAINTSPQTRIFLGNKTNFANEISFTIYIINTGANPPTQWSTLTGDLSISMDFIQYR
jgi:hypothetical protein